MDGTKTMIIGLTGQTGAGKSTLSGMFAERSVAVINADAVARDTMEHSKSCLMDLVLAFSTEVIHPDATLNREKLAEICFSDRKKLRRLNEVTYPYIIEAIAHKIEQARARGGRMLLLDAPTLYESGLDKRCDCVVAVIADEQTRARRIIARDHMTQEAAMRRINAQNNDAFYTGRADYVIENNGDEDALRFAFMDLMEKLERRARGGEPVVQPPADPEQGAGDFEELTGSDE